MDYSDIFSIIGDLNETKGGSYYEPVHYKLNLENEVNIEQFLDKFTNAAFDNEDESFIDLVTEDPVEDGNENDNESAIAHELLIKQGLIHHNSEVIGNNEEAEDNICELIDDKIFNQEENDNFILEDSDLEENSILEVEELKDKKEKEETLGDMMIINIEEVARENRDAREIAYQGKTELKKELQQEQETFEEDPKSVYKDINDLITRYKDVL